MIEFNDLLSKAGFDPKRVMVMRHLPTEKALRRALPALAAEHHAVYNAYQSQHGVRVEEAMGRAAYLASFIGHETGRAIFVGMYENAGRKQIDARAFWRIPENRVLKELGTRGPSKGDRPQWFDLVLLPALAAWKGRLVVAWPGIERAWWRWADRNCFQVTAIHDESRLVARMPEAAELVLSWSEIATLPASWRNALSQWRGVYHIFDAASGKGYVGSACGAENILGRWVDYAASGHGGNRLLRACDPKRFSFSVLQLLSPQMPSVEVVAVENSWKRRLHTHAPHGLNEN